MSTYGAARIINIVADPADLVLGWATGLPSGDYIFDWHMFRYSLSCGRGNPNRPKGKGPCLCPDCIDERIREKAECFRGVTERSPIFDAIVRRMNDGSQHE